MGKSADYRQLFDVNDIYIYISSILGVQFQFKYKMADQDISQYIIPNNTDVAILDCQEAFGILTEKEKLYAHHLAQASFKGGLIVLFQVNN